MIILVCSFAKTMKFEEKLIIHGRIVEAMQRPRATIDAVAKRLRLSWATVKALQSPPCPRKCRAVTAKVARRREVVSRVVRLKKKVGSHEYRVHPSAKSISKAPPLAEHKRSPETIRRDLHFLGYSSVVRKFVPTRDSDVIKRRFDFCKEWLSRGRKDDLERIVFSDEHWVSCNDVSHRQMWVKKNDVVFSRERKRPQNVPRFQVWAAIGVDFKSELVLFPVSTGDFFGEQAFRLDSDGYVRRCLGKVKGVLVSQNRVFMQDGASAHTSAQTKKYLATSNIRYITNWPPYSPDLNPIEQLWAILNRRIADDYHPQTFEELREAAVAAWKAIPMSTINNLVRSFSAKLRRVAENGGFP